MKVYNQLLTCTIALMSLMAAVSAPSVSKLQEGVLVLPLGECVHDVLGEGGGVQALVQAVSISSIRGCSSFNFAFREGFKKCEGQQKYGNFPYFFHKLFPYNTVIIVFKGLKVQK